MHLLHTIFHLGIFQCGADILSRFRGDHPLSDLILSGVRAHVDRFGDGAKSVALIISGLLNALEAKGLAAGDGEGRCRILAQIRDGRTASHRTSMCFPTMLKCGCVKMTESRQLAKAFLENS